MKKLLSIIQVLVFACYDRIKPNVTSLFPDVFTALFLPLTSNFMLKVLVKKRLTDLCFISFPFCFFCEAGKITFSSL